MLYVVIQRTNIWRKSVWLKETGGTAPPDPVGMICSSGVISGSCPVRPIRWTLRRWLIAFFVVLTANDAAQLRSGPGFTSVWSQRDWESISQCGIHLEQRHRVVPSRMYSCPLAGSHTKLHLLRLAGGMGRAALLCIASVGDRSLLSVEGCRSDCSGSSGREVLESCDMPPCVLWSKEMYFNLVVN